MANCYWCGIELSDTTRWEHIIKESFGGKLKSRKVLCSKHNNELGNAIDNRISTEMNYLYDSLMLYKTGKRIRLYKKDGTSAIFGVGFKPLPYLEYNIEGKDYEQHFDTEKELIKKAEQLRKQLKGKGEIREFRWKDLPSTSSEYFFHESGQVFWGTQDFFLSFIKIAIGFFIHYDGEKSYVEHAIKVLKEEINDSSIAQFYHSDLYKVDVSKNEVNHFIYLHGDPERRILYCYIELFSTHKVLVFLNSEYDGERIEKQYCLNVITKEQYTKSFKMDLTREHYIDIPQIKWDYQEQHQVCYNRLISIIQEQINTQK